MNLSQSQEHALWLHQEGRLLKLLTQSTSDFKWKLFISRVPRPLVLRSDWHQRKEWPTVVDKFDTRILLNGKQNRLISPKFHAKFSRVGLHFFCLWATTLPTLEYRITFSQCVKCNLYRSPQFTCWVSCRPLYLPATLPSKVPPYQHTAQEGCIQTTHSWLCNNTLDNQVH